MAGKVENKKLEEYENENYYWLVSVTRQVARSLEKR